MKRITSKAQRQRRIRTKLKANTGMIRLSVFRSNQYVYAQLIDDVAGKTIAAVNEKTLTIEEGITKLERAKKVGLELAKKGVEKKVARVVFDKGSYAYHGRVKAIAEGAREGGLSF